MAEIDLLQSAERALALMRAAGFDAARAEASVQRGTELNVAHNEPSLWRSTTQHKLALAGIVDGRMASTELTGLDDDDALHTAVKALHADTCAAPQDPANALSAGQVLQLEQGPQQADEALIADKVAELLAFRARETPAMMLEEALVAHQHAESRLLSSGGSDLQLRVGCYRIAAIGTAREGQRVSSFNFTDGTAHALDAPIERYAGLEPLLRDTVRQIETQPLAAKFTGDLVLTPPAVTSLLGWLFGQLGDLQLIAGSSLYREQVGQMIASPMLTLASRFDGPGIAAVSADGHVARSVELLHAGRLVTLTPSLYGSRKTGLPQVPVAAAGWEIGAGTTPLAELLAEVRHGALVGRLSMGNPASNGDFSGVIKNSFLLEGGTLGPALREVMVSGNIAAMLQDVIAVSRERLDTGLWSLPWLRIGGLHFS